jgi:hypothetical protein
LLIGSDELARALYEELCTLPEYKLAWLRPVDSVRGALALRVADVDAAQGYFQAGLSFSEGLGVDVGAGLCLQGLAEVAERRGEREQAMEYLDRAGELFSRHGAKLYLDQVLAEKDILKA